MVKETGGIRRSGRGKDGRGRKSIIQCRSAPEITSLC